MVDTKVPIPTTFVLNSLANQITNTIMLQKVFDKRVIRDRKPIVKNISQSALHQIKGRQVGSILH